MADSNFALLKSELFSKPEFSDFQNDTEIQPVVYFLICTLRAHPDRALVRRNSLWQIFGFALCYTIRFERSSYRKRFQGNSTRFLGGFGFCCEFHLSWFSFTWQWVRQFLRVLPWKYDWEYDQIGALLWATVPSYIYRESVFGLWKSEMASFEARQTKSDARCESASQNIPQILKFRYQTQVFRKICLKKKKKKIWVTTAVTIFNKGKKTYSDSMFVPHRSLAQPTKRTKHYNPMCSPLNKQKRRKNNRILHFPHAPYVNEAIGKLVS